MIPVEGIRERGRIGRKTMETNVGYVLVSKTMRGDWHHCPDCASQLRLCPIPETPGCHAACVRDPKLLAEHPDCQAWQRKYEDWVTAHRTEEHTGGTRLGPLHYFSD